MTEESDGIILIENIFIVQDTFKCCCFFFLHFFFNFLSNDTKKNKKIVIITHTGYNRNDMRKYCQNLLQNVDHCKISSFRSKL